MGANFIVRTEDEKLAAKLARKERKKHGGRDEEDEAALSSAMLGFDQEDLRKAREEQLRNNAAKPLASSQQVRVSGGWHNEAEASRHLTIWERDKTSSFIEGAESTIMKSYFFLI